MATDRLLYYGNLMVASTVSACPLRARRESQERYLTVTYGHVVLDNYGTHKHPEVRKWLARPENKRITLHFTPTSCSWLNVVEIF